MLSEKDVNYVRELFNGRLKGEVGLELFIEPGSNYSDAAVELLGELSRIEKKIKLSVIDISKEKEKKRERGVDRAPALMVSPEKGYKLYYFGVPSGYQFAALLEDIIDASAGTSRLSGITKDNLKKIQKPVDIKVFVDSMEELCARAVRIAHQFSMENSMIRSSMIDLNQFPEVTTHTPMSVLPHVVINNVISFEGPLPENEFLEYVLASVK